FSAAVPPVKSGGPADGAVPRGLRGAAADTAATLGVVVVRDIAGIAGPGVSDGVSRGNGKPPVANGLRGRTVRQSRRRNRDPAPDDLQEVATHCPGRVDRS